MARSQKLEALLDSLAQIRHAPASDLGVATLRQVLTSKYSVAVAQAANLVGTAEIYSLIPELVAAFNRFMTKPSETDQNCLAKAAIAEALYRLNYSDESLFLTGIHHIQMESVWGGKDDTAAKLRGVCALGLVRMNYPEVMVELADLLADAKPEARIAAARAIAYSGSPQGVPLLRMRVRIGDEAQVLSDCLVALLQLAPTQSLSLLKELLYARRNASNVIEDVEKAEVAALALGESRQPEAFELLKTWWKQTRAPELRQSGLLAIAMLRNDTALDFLLSLVAEGTDSVAKDAIAALSLYQQDNGLWQRVHQLVERRGIPALLQAFERASR
jgi:hypothetical protein